MRLKYLNRCLSAKPARCSRELMLIWIDYYVWLEKAKNLSLGIECSKCMKWRSSKEYKDDNVPADWDCSMWTTESGEKGNCDMPEIGRISSDESHEDYVPGNVVWVKYPKLWWPGMIEDSPEKMLYRKWSQSKEQYHVTFFGSKVTRQWMYKQSITKFSECPVKDLREKLDKNAELKCAYEQALHAAQLTLKERFATYSFAHLYDGFFTKVIYYDLPNYDGEENEVNGNEPTHERRTVETRSELSNGKKEHPGDTRVEPASKAKKPTSSRATRNENRAKKRRSSGSDASNKKRPSRKRPTVADSQMCNDDKTPVEEIPTVPRKKNTKSKCSATQTDTNVIISMSTYSDSPIPSKSSTSNFKKATNSDSPIPSKSSTSNVKKGRNNPVVKRNVMNFSSCSSPHCMSLSDNREFNLDSEGGQNRDPYRLSNFPSMTRKNRPTIKPKVPKCNGQAKYMMERPHSGNEDEKPFDETPILSIESTHITNWMFVPCNRFDSDREYIPFHIQN